MPFPHLTRDEQLFGPGPKRILALDGGGVRGALTLSYIERMETMVGERAGNPRGKYYGQWPNSQVTALRRLLAKSPLSTAAAAGGEAVAQT